MSIVNGEVNSNENLNDEQLYKNENSDENIDQIEICIQYFGKS